MPGELGASAGEVSDLSSASLNGDYPTIADQAVDAQTSRVQPRQVATGVTRGTQRIVNTDGSYVTLGEIPDGSGDFGIAHFNASGTIIFKNTGVTEYKYDVTGRNYYQNGKLPDGSYGEAIAKSPYSVGDAITA
jgi:hypothetical protein